MRTPTRYTAGAPGAKPARRCLRPGRRGAGAQWPPTLAGVISYAQYELYKWVKRESDETTALDTIALVDDSLVIPLSTDIALTAADLSLSRKLAFADAVIYASARKYDVELVTSEVHFEDLPGVTYFPKRGA